MKNRYNLPYGGFAVPEFGHKREGVLQGDVKKYVMDSPVVVVRAVGNATLAPRYVKVQQNGRLVTIEDKVGYLPSTVEV